MCVTVSCVLPCGCVLPLGVWLCVTVWLCCVNPRVVVRPLRMKRASSLNFLNKNAEETTQVGSDRSPPGSDSRGPCLPFSGVSLVEALSRNVAVVVCLVVSVQEAPSGLSDCRGLSSSNVDLTRRSSVIG